MPDSYDFREHSRKMKAMNVRESKKKHKGGLAVAAAVMMMTMTGAPGLKLCCIFHVKCLLIAAL